MGIDGWDNGVDALIFARGRGDVTLLVCRLDGRCWGFTAWRARECLGGRCSVDWTAEDACTQALASPFGR